MNILVVNYYCYPLTNAHSYRWSRLINHYIHSGHTVDVITSRSKDTPKFDAIGNLSIFRRSFYERKSSNSSTSSSSSLSFLVSLVHPLRLLYRFFYWPDARWHWFLSLLPLFFQLRSKKYDLVVSYYPSFSAHLFAFLFRLFSVNRSTSWVLDYGDPFSVSSNWTPNNYLLYGSLNKLVELFFQSQDAKFVFTNNETYSQNNHIKLSSKYVIPHMVDLKLFHASNFLVRSNSFINSSSPINLIGWLLLPSYS